jgi:hypothetical protein
MGSGAREHAGAAYAVYRSGYGDKCTHTCWYTMREVPGGRSERGSGGYAGVHTAAQVRRCGGGHVEEGARVLSDCRGRQRICACTYMWVRWRRWAYAVRAGAARAHGCGWRRCGDGSERG